MLKSLKNKLLARLLTAVNPNDVMTSDKLGNLYLNGELMSDDAAANLRVEADQYQNMHLSRILSETLKDQAQIKMFRDSKTDADIVAGKMMLYNLDVQHTIVELIRSSKK